MDICLIETESGTHIRPESVHGILWLQTHFEDAHWEAIAAKKVIVPNGDAKNLLNDAHNAGLGLNYISANTISIKFNPSSATSF